MDIQIAAYRNRIGSFNPSNKASYISEYSRKPSYKSRTRTIYNVRKLLICMVLVISMLSRIELDFGEVSQDSSQNFKYIGPFKYIGLSHSITSCQLLCAWMPDICFFLPCQPSQLSWCFWSPLCCYSLRGSSCAPHR